MNGSYKRTQAIAITALYAQNRIMSGLANYNDMGTPNFQSIIELCASTEDEISRPEFQATLRRMLKEIDDNNFKRPFINLTNPSHLK